LKYLGIRLKNLVGHKKPFHSFTKPATAHLTPQSMPYIAATRVGIFHAILWEFYIKRVKLEGVIPLCGKIIYLL
jgi:hypothetical protein